MSELFKAPEHPSPQLKVVLQYLDCLSTWNFDHLSKLTTDGFTQTTLPSSLKVAVRSKADDLSFLKQLQEQLGGSNLQITIYEVNEGNNKVWAHILLHGQSPSGVTLNVECIYLFTFGEGYHSDKVIGVKDFTDSAAMAAFSSPAPASATA
ncbi:hypothetical protein BC834DRAFT_971596 [Gloeopeniophorella convolvens]|nr:hypothetical protein BC834DRAFT_971596 [Gloeopeniophorella convolvens]